MPERSSYPSGRPSCRSVLAILTGPPTPGAHAEHAQELQILALSEQREQEGVMPAGECLAVQVEIGAWRLGGG